MNFGSIRVAVEGATPAFFDIPVQTHTTSPVRWEPIALQISNGPRNARLLLSSEWKILKVAPKNGIVVESNEEDPGLYQVSRGSLVGLGGLTAVVTNGEITNEIELPIIANAVTE